MSGAAGISAHRLHAAAPLLPRPPTRRLPGFRRLVRDLHFASDDPAAAADPPEAHSAAAAALLSARLASPPPLRSAAIGAALRSAVLDASLLPPGARYASSAAGLEELFVGAAVAAAAAAAAEEEAAAADVPQTPLASVQQQPGDLALLLSATTVRGGGGGGEEGGDHDDDDEEDGGILGEWMGASPARASPSAHANRPVVEPPATPAPLPARAVPLAPPALDFPAFCDVMRAAAARRFGSAEPSAHVPTLNETGLPLLAAHCLVPAAEAAGAAALHAALGSPDGLHAGVPEGAFAGAAAAVAPSPSPPQVPELPLVPPAVAAAAAAVAAALAVVRALAAALAVDAASRRLFSANRQILRALFVHYASRPGLGCAATAAVGGELLARRRTGAAEATARQRSGRSVSRERSSSFAAEGAASVGGDGRARSSGRRHSSLRRDSAAHGVPASLASSAFAPADADSLGLDVAQLAALAHDFGLLGGVVTDLGRLHVLFDAIHELQVRGAWDRWGEGGRAE